MQLFVGTHLRHISRGMGVLVDIDWKNERGRPFQVSFGEENHQYTLEAMVSKFKIVTGQDSIEACKDKYQAEEQEGLQHTIDPDTNAPAHPSKRTNGSLPGETLEQAEAARQRKEEPAGMRTAVVPMARVPSDAAENLEPVQTTIAMPSSGVPWGSGLLEDDRPCCAKWSGHSSLVRPESVGSLESILAADRAMDSGWC